MVHDTGNTGQGADSAAHFAYFNSADRGASADFFVDDKGALCVNDYQKYATWHCGDGKGKKGITNQNSVGVELCVNADGDCYEMFFNAVRLVARLMQELGIPPENVVRHYDVSGKLCPASMSQNNWEDWEFFHYIVSDDAMFLRFTFGLEEQTTEYLENYTYGKALMQKLKTAMFI